MIILPKQTNNKTNNIKLKPAKNKKEPINKTLEGVLINNHYHKNDSVSDIVDFSDISNNLLITDSIEKQNKEDSKEKNDGQSFDIKKVMLPLIVAAGATLAATLGISSLLRKVSNNILNVNISEQLPDLALNMNIKQEPHFATYRMLRDPSKQNMIAAGAVFIFSGLTIMGRNFLNGVKEVWVKKQQADIERDLQENLIDVEAQAFSGKLKVVNAMLNDNVKYFKNVLNTSSSIQNQLPSPLPPSTFLGLSFKKNSEKIEADNNKKNTNNNKKQNILLGLTALGVIIAGVLVGKHTYKSIKETIRLAQKYTDDFTEKIIDEMEKTVETAVQKEEITPEITTKLTNCFQAASIKPQRIKEVMRKLHYSESEIDNMLSGCDEARHSIFADAPTALGGIPKKIQYYCYLDENRGHLYNWIIHPENKFTKYIFLSFSAVSIVGSIVENVFDMIKMVGVERENAKTELNLKKRLVDVEIRNFKAKKESAINPLIDDFNRKLKAGTDKQELKQKAENILVEIKNGPPYVYS